MVLCVHLFLFHCRWEDCKQLLLSQNFFESLKFFDRDNVPKRKLKTLEKMITKNSDLGLIEHGSKAAVPLHMWVKALVDYHKAKMAVQPSREELAEAERTLGDVSLTGKLWGVCFCLMR